MPSHLPDELDIPAQTHPHLPATSSSLRYGPPPAAQTLGLVADADVADRYGGLEAWAEEALQITDDAPYVQADGWNKWTSVDTSSPYRVPYVARVHELLDSAVAGPASTQK